MQVQVEQFNYRKHLFHFRQIRMPLPDSKKSIPARMLPELAEC